MVKQLWQGWRGIHQGESSLGAGRPKYDTYADLKAGVIFLDECLAELDFGVGIHDAQIMHQLEGEVLHEMASIVERCCCW